MPRARLVPERTIDSLLVYELLTAVPTARIWSPSNTAGAWDHELSTNVSSRIIFECKALDGDASNPKKPWRIPIDRTQLVAYTGLPFRVTYVLPARPTYVWSPWLRECNVDPSSSNGMCRACFTPVKGNPRRWVGKQPLWSAEPPHRLVQPWFNHWAWCLTARHLEKELSSSGVSWLSAADSDLASIPGSIRLCHLLAWTDKRASRKRRKRAAAFQAPVKRDAGFQWPSGAYPDDAGSTGPIIADFPTN